MVAFIGLLEVRFGFSDNLFYILSHCARVCVCAGGGGGVVRFLVPNRPAENDRAGSFTLIVLWLPVFCV